MAKFKKAGKKTGPSSAQAQADQLSKKLSESAQQVWLAGVGAFGRAQAEGTKLFEALVKEGMNFEQGARRFAGGRADVVRDAVEARVGQARERASDTWDRLEKVFEDRVQRALVKLFDGDAEAPRVTAYLVQSREAMVSIECRVFNALGFGHARGGGTGHGLVGGTLARLGQTRKGEHGEA